MRDVVHVHQLSPEIALDALTISPDASQLPNGQEPVISAGIYLWCDAYERLEAKTWSYEEFVRERVWRWERKETIHYTNAASIDFGHQMKKLFSMAPEWLNLNHGQCFP